MKALALALVLAACGTGDGSADLSYAGIDFTTPPAGDGGVQCGAVQCHAELSQICCIEPQYEYCASSEACSAGIALYCDGPQDCMGGVCCQTAASTVSCAQSCTGALVCRTDADCPAPTPRCCGTLATSTHKTCSSSC